jgi:hypothetical protein
VGTGADPRRCLPRQEDDKDAYGDGIEEALAAAVAAG